MSLGEGVLDILGLSRCGSFGVFQPGSTYGVRKARLGLCVASSLSRTADDLFFRRTDDCDCFSVSPNESLSIEIDRT